MIATPLLLCQGALVLPAAKTPNAVPLMCSPRGVLLEIRRDIRALAFPHDFTHRLTKARRDRRPRKTAKQKRDWPPHSRQRPPTFRG